MLRSGLKIYLILILVLILVIVVFQQNGYGKQNKELNFVTEWLEENLVIAELDLQSVSNLTEDISLVEFTNLKQKPTYALIRINKSNDYELLEFGFGEYTPYTDKVIINEEIILSEATRLQFISPMESFWITNLDGETVYVDAATGDLLPVLANYDPEQLQNNHFLIKSNDVVEAYLDTGLAFDPFIDLGWLIDKPTNDSLHREEIKNLLTTNNAILYTGEKYDHSYSFAYPVIGYMKNKDSFYLALYDQNLNVIRYIAYDDLLNYGQFSQVSLNN